MSPVCANWIRIHLPRLEECLVSNPNRRGAMALVSASLCLTLAALFYFTAPAPALTASAPIAVPAAADWGLSFPTEGESPVGNASAEDLAQYGAYYLGDTSQKVLYLTFDCGYENGCTEAILDALKKHNAPAAFFVVGHMIESAPDIVRRMAAEGHIVGNHTYHHPDMSSISDMAAFQKELTDLESVKELHISQIYILYLPGPACGLFISKQRQCRALQLLADHQTVYQCGRHRRHDQTVDQQIGRSHDFHGWQGKIHDTVLHLPAGTILRKAQDTADRTS